MPTRQLIITSGGALERLNLSYAAASAAHDPSCKVTDESHALERSAVSDLLDGAVSK